MGCFTLFKIKPHGNPEQYLPKKPVMNQNGSMILVAMLLLLMMTIIGISASNTSVTESYIIRNVGIYKQNMNLVEAAVLDLCQEVIVNTQPPPNARLGEKSPAKAIWVIDIVDWKNTIIPSGSLSYHDAWYDMGTAGAGQIFADDDLDPTTGFPPYTWPGDTFFAEDTTTSPSGDLTILDTRGETDDIPLRMALVGWEVVQGAPIDVIGETRMKARILAEYVSPNYGLIRLEIGLERNFRDN